MYTFERASCLKPFFNSIIMKNIYLVCISLFFSIVVPSQNIQHAAPPNWWVGMQNPELQIMLHGENIAQLNVSINYPGVTLYKKTTVENPNYVFLDLVIDAGTAPGTMEIKFGDEKTGFSFPYLLEARIARTFDYGLHGGDFIYLLMPDRFCNGDTQNDIINTMHETTIDRSKVTTRHGGDLQGIISKLDYISQLGTTAIWSTPMLENNQPLYSYHGYAITNHYQIDPRIGNNDLYKQFVQQSHQRNVKVVYDVVHNHVGDKHWFIQDLPMADWVNQWDTFTRTNYRTSSLHDMYASEADKNLMSNGWFDTQMPDLNQRNPFVATYLIQNNIWWVEFAHIDAFRLDTYPYSDLQFLIDWEKAVTNEYPGFGIFAEVWVEGVGVQGYFTGNNNLNTGYNTGLPGVTDFNLYEAMHRGLNENFGWYEGMRRIYHALTQDYIYGSAYNNVVFLSNHDVSRIYSMMGKSLAKTKMAAVFFMTTRGIPQWYYGDEILFEGFGNPLDALRPDFPGGWEGDAINKFNPDNLQGDEKEYYHFITTLANWRKNNEVFKNGKLMQFIPEDGVYVYFRYTENACAMVIINSNMQEKEIDTNRFSERMGTYSKGKNVITDENYNSLQKIKIPKQSALVIELSK